MNTIFSRKIPLFLSLLLLLSLSTGCRVTLVAPQDAVLLEQIGKVTESVDTFYLKMLESNSRDYAAYSDTYISIEVQLNSILAKNKLKAQNTETAKIAQNVRDTWVKYKGEHKSAGKLNDGEIKYNNSTMADFMFALSVAENAKPK